MITEITDGQALLLIEELCLVVGSSFTNPEPNERFPWSEVMTGYWLENGKSALVKRITKRYKNGNDVTKNYLQLTFESLGVDTNES